MSNDRLKYLLEQYAADASTPAEIKELFEWIKKSNDDSILKHKVKELWSVGKNEKQLPDVDWNKIYTNIINIPIKNKKSIWSYIAAAVAIVLFFSVSVYLIFNNHSEKQIAKLHTERNFKNNVLPGGNKAILTLANGKKIILDNAGEGALAQQGNIKIIKLDSGSLAYQSLNSKVATVLYNTISTPRGGQYQVLLSDGSKVWLNAASSLRFPTSFTQKERNVQLTGEGYFEVAHNPKKPFNVKIGNITVKVLGTHFNINAYNDESVVRTTLLEGSIKISKGTSSEMVRPGQQAVIGQVQDNQGKIKIINVDGNAAIAWKNGRFNFQGNNIQSVMRQLARWYDVNVNYHGNVTKEEFVGVLNRSRYENIYQILKMLEMTKTVSFSISGHNITVMPFEK